ncbi:MAG: hypothetical protein AAF561_01700 [Planctomycetota bacterium]
MSYHNELRNEPAIINFTGNMDTVINDDPARFNIEAGRASAYSSTRTEFTDAYETYHTDATHSTPYRVKKDVMKAHLVNSTRDLCETFLADRSLDETTLALVGLRRRSKGSPAPMPTTAPLVQGRVDSATSIKLSFRDASDSDRRAKPAGVRQVAVATFIGEEPPTDVTAWGQPRLFGRTDQTLRFETLTSQTVWVTSWWINSRNEFGPASAPVSFRIAGTSGAVPQQRSETTKMKIAA